MLHSRASTSRCEPPFPNTKPSARVLLISTGAGAVVSTTPLDLTGIDRILALLEVMLCAALYATTEQFDVGSCMSTLPTACRGSSYQLLLTSCWKTAARSAARLFPCCVMCKSHFHPSTLDQLGATVYHFRPMLKYKLVHPACY